MNTPFNQRPYHAFLSHSSKDNADFADDLYAWLEKKAGLKVWYDRALQCGQPASGLDRAIDACRSAVLVLSQGSAQSEYADLKYSRIRDEAAKHRDFRIVSVRLDDCDPGLLGGARRIDAADAKWSPQSASLLLESLFGGADASEGRPVYVSRGWREADAALSDGICAAAKAFGLRLVCDWPDQASYDEARVKSLIDSCGAMLAILPDRGEGATSEYVVREIKTAVEGGLPTIVFAAETAAGNDWGFSPIRVPEAVAQRPRDWALSKCGTELENLALSWRKPRSGEHVFLGHSLEETVDEMFLTARRLVSRLVGLPVAVGGLVAGSEAQREIVRLIQDAEFCLIDITNHTYADLPDKIDFALNSVIEAGIALGAERNVYLTCAGKRRSPPFMFRNKQIWFYKSELDLVGIIRQICARHRRLVL